jgi:hypothetical protein
MTFATPCRCTEALQGLSWNQRPSDARKPRHAADGLRPRLMPDVSRL